MSRLEQEAVSVLDASNYVLIYISVSGYAVAII